MTTTQIRVQSKAFGMNSPMSRFDAAKFLGGEDALEPALGQQLAEKVIEALTRHGQQLVVDFARVKVVSSAFANAFFIRLALQYPLTSISSLVDFTNLRPQVADVWGKSYRAVRDRQAREQGGDG